MRAEAGHEPRSSGLRLPKYWDYKRAPPRPALYFILKPGLTKLRRASLGRERERERERERQGERERERAEAGREPGSSGLRLPKYWDYKRAPPRLALRINYLHYVDREYN